ncbi:MAG: endopeptidase La [Spirochaetes bacterium RBG_13_51_14]|nr:MAG: endopeptidase La [Spirochaetes bacterium RBG_13_51_14]
MPIDTNLLESDLITIDQALPSKLYIIPIRYRPIFPGIITPLIISHGRFTDVIDKVIHDTRTIGLILIKDDNKDEIAASDLYHVGTAAKILKRINLPDGGLNVLINSIKRFRIRRFISEEPYIFAEVEYLEDSAVDKKGIEFKAVTREVLSKLKMLTDNNPLFTEEMKLTMLNVDEPGKIADFVTSILNIEKTEYQDILETLNVKKRLQKVLRLLHKEIEVLSVQKRIQGSINEKIDKQQRDFFLREQLKAIKHELGIEDDERSRELKNLRKKMQELELDGEIKERMEEEIGKITVMDPTSSEYAVTRNYIDTVLSLPWNRKTVDSIDLAKAEKILDRDHYGLEDVKKRILEFLAVKILKPSGKGSIICLVGPPGVGKTSLGRSIARALNRKFFRISLGGMRDEAEIKGHRRTYVGAMPGKIIQGLKICKYRNPVFMLDEIDKLGQSFQGDPASALLEVLDPEQNAEFRDYYIDAPFNLSDVLFITTANTVDTVPQVLADRMEIIRLSGYIANEKYEIARRYLLPKQLEQHGLPKNGIRIDKKGFMHIINNYAREAGVRNLERQIEKICRKTATFMAKNRKIPAGTLEPKTIREYLGTELYADESLIKITKTGLAIGLAWTPHGGTPLVVESIGITNRKGGGLKLTGQLGDIMSESATIAYSYVQHLLKDRGDAAKVFSRNLIHIHVPAGATPKDGPSAGITMASSLYSMATNKKIRPGIAMTGELTLTGRVFPVGGIKEKIIAAKKANLKEIILPRENSKDLDDIPDYIKKGLNFHLVDQIEEVITIAFNDKKKKSKKAKGRGGSSCR